MNFRLTNPPLRYVVATFGIEKHPSIQSLAGKAYEDLKILGLDGYDKVILPSIKVQQNLPPQLVNVEQGHFFEDDYKTLLIVQENSLSIATYAYDGFDVFSAYLTKLFSILTKHDFPNVTSSTYRYVNEFPVDELPTNLINHKFQGDASLWKQSKHIHLDSKFWIDIDNSKHELWLAIKGSKKHVTTADNISSLPRNFTSKTSLKPEKSGLAVDLWHNSKELVLNYDAGLIKELDSQREKIKEIFESLLTEESRLMWKYETTTKS